MKRQVEMMGSSVFLDDNRVCVFVCFVVGDRIFHRAWLLDSPDIWDLKSIMEEVDKQRRNLEERIATGII